MTRPTNDCDGMTPMVCDGTCDCSWCRARQCVEACADMADPSAEIARLRADVERLRGAIAPVVAEINNRWADVHDESWSADYHCEFEMTVAECRTLLLAAAALADTADKQL